MPAGLKQTSAVVPIGFSVTESAANTYTQAQVDLNLSPLDREVFVVLAVNLDSGVPETITGTNTAVRTRLTTTSQTAIVGLDNSNCLAALSHFTESDAQNAVGYSSQALETPPSTLEYIGIIATNDFFVSIQGINNANAQGASGKIYGYRAIATADIYAALVQSEVLSA
jgi:hypothetical protein